jgi:hypothetical protein
LKFRWSDAPIEGERITVIAKVAPASVVKDWEFTSGAKKIKINVNKPTEMYAGFETFFRMCRQKGITVTLVHPTVKLFFFNEGQRIKMVVAGQSVNIQDYDYAGIIDADSEKADDLNDITEVQWTVFKDAIDKAQGRIAKLDYFDNLPKGRLTEFHGQYLAKPQEAINEIVDSSPHDVVEVEASTNETGSKQGCYLVIEKVSGAEGGFTLVSMYSRDDSFASDDKTPVGFFEPSQSKVSSTSWKYDTGNRRPLMYGTIAGGGQLPRDYLKNFASFLNEGRKMEGKFTLLPKAKAKVAFMRPVGAGLVEHAVVNTPIDLMDKDYVVVLDEGDTDLDGEGWTYGTFLTAVQRKSKAYKSWVKN